METTQMELSLVPPSEERLLWHPPEVRRLQVSLETEQKAGSIPDSEIAGSHSTATII